MKTFLSASAAAIAAVTMMGSVALADPGDDLSDTLGGAFTDLLGQYEDGSLSNFAVNNAGIDGSVVAKAAQTALETDTTETTVEILGQGFTNTDTDQTVIDVKQNVGNVKTTAVGAMNDGTIKSTSESASLEVELEIEGQASAATSTNKSASAMAESLDIEGSLEYEYSGVPDIVATNFAFNSAAVNGSVNLDGLGASSITTIAAGAVNTGVIEVGIE